MGVSLGVEAHTFKGDGAIDIVAGHLAVEIHRVVGKESVVFFEHVAHALHPGQCAVVTGYTCAARTDVADENNTVGDINQTGNGIVVGRSRVVTGNVFVVFLVSVVEVSVNNTVGRIEVALATAYEDYKVHVVACGVAVQLFQTADHGHGYFQRTRIVAITAQQVRQITG